MFTAATDYDEEVPKSRSVCPSHGARADILPNAVLFIILKGDEL